MPVKGGKWGGKKYNKGRRRSILEKKNLEVER